MITLIFILRLNRAYAFGAWLSGFARLLLRGRSTTQLGRDRSRPRLAVASA